MGFICNDAFCTGCGACAEVCSLGAITLCNDSYGFLRPIIDENKCINCNKCVKTCPANNLIDEFSPQKIYAALSVDEKIKDGCASGGIASSLYKHFIEKENGIVYGVILKNNRASYIRVNTAEKLESLRGSKYVSSKLGESYLQIRNDLENHKKVLFIGLPCQIAGLFKVIPDKLKSNLYTVDLICHGVPSAEHLVEHIKKRYGNHAQIVRFRNKNGDFVCSIKKKNRIVEIPFAADLYMLAFLNGENYRESCYSCKYAKNKRISDLTIGDFWGLNSNNSKIYNSNRVSVSLVLSNTEKGNAMCKAISQDAIWEEHTLEEAIKKNAQLSQPSQMPEHFYEFMQNVSKYGFEKAASEKWKKRVNKNYIHCIIKNLFS